MSKATGHQGNWTERRAALMAKLSERLDEVTTNRSYLKDIHLESSEDICTLYMEGKLAELERLATEINAFTNPGNHFTKMYITLEARCGKLQRDLDEIDVTGRSDLGKDQREGLERVRNLIANLAEKVHRNGEKCNFGC